jgi:hypothetical protein
MKREIRFITLRSQDMPENLVSIVADESDLPIDAVFPSSAEGGPKLMQLGAEAMQIRSNDKPS